VRLDLDDARRRFATARIARLATVAADGRPHAVPIVFAVGEGEVVYTAVDAKPKSTRELRRLANIAANPAVSLLADHYDEDWAQLWWVRADGLAHVADPEGATAGLRLLTARYPQYAEQPPPGPVIVVQVQRWTGWQSAG